MEISVVIPCYNAADTIGVQLEALTNQHWPYNWEVIIADNRSTDATMRVVESYKDRLPNLKTVQAYGKQGVSYALNVAVRAVDGMAILFCDADDMVGENWLMEMGNALLEHDFVACRFEVQKLNPKKLSGGAPGNPQGRGLQKIWYPPYLPHAGGSSLGIKTAIHRKVGGFDESLRYLQDTDYCFRVQLAGTPLHFVPTTVIHVRHRASLIGLFRQSLNYAEYNVVIFKRYRKTAPEKPHLWRNYLKDWKNLVKSLKYISDRHRREYLAWNLGRQIGRFKGICRQKVAPV